jgi:hypothetical protein
MTQATHIVTQFGRGSSSTYWTFEFSTGGLQHAWIEAKPDGIYFTQQDDLEGELKRCMSWDDFTEWMMEDVNRDAAVQDELNKRAGGI